MSTHTKLSIYKVSYDLLNLATDLSKNMPRDSKRIGTKLNDECFEVMLLIFRANVARDKTPHIDELLERLQVVELMFRLSKDKRFISIPQYAKAIELTSMIGKQANGWKKYAASSPAV